MEYVWGYGMIAYFVIVLFAVWISIGRDFSDNDSWYCWGLVVKSYARYFDVHNLGTALCPHPTLIPIWNFIAVETWFGFAEGICLFAQNLFMLSLLIPVISYVEKVGYKKFFVIMVVILAFPFFEDGGEYRMLAVDRILGLLSFVSLSFYDDYRNNRSRFDILAITSFLSAIVLTKRIGIVVAVMVLTIILFCEIQNETHDYLFIGPIIAIAIAYFSWNGKSMLMLAPILSLLAAVALNTVYKLLHKLFHDDYLFVYFGIVGTIIIAIIGFILSDEKEMAKEFAFNMGMFFGNKSQIAICGFLFFIIYYKYKKREGADLLKIKRWNELATITTVMVGYFFFIQYLGIASIPDRGIDFRYFYPIFVPFILSFLLLVLRNYSKEGVILFSIILLLLTNESTMFNVLMTKAENMYYYGFEEAGIELKEGDTIFFINETDVDLNRDRQFYYFVFPAKTNLVDTEEWMNNHNNSLEIECEELSNILLDRYNYVYLQTFNDDFVDRYGDLFDDVNSIKAGAVYYVTQKEDEAMLVLAGE